MSASESSWRRWVAGELRRLGFGSRAQSFGACGRTALVRVCGGCGEVEGAEIRVSCGLRCCPGCERRAAAERAARVAGAALRVPELVALAAARVHAEVGEDLAAAISARDHWETLGRLARARHAARGRARDLEAAEGHALRASRAEVRRARFKRWAIETEARRVASGAWRWRLITVSPCWNPRDPGEYTVAGLARRLEDLRARTDSLWTDALRVGGLAAATVRVELSALGHVHAHILYFGPFQHAKHLRKLAGCFVDVRELDVIAGDVAGMRRAVVEATKYALKSVSPARQQWMAGERWRVVHPRLAAAWVAATQDAQLVTHRGMMRTAMAVEEIAPQVDSDDPAPCACCRRCGAEVCAVGEVWSVERLARELPPGWWRDRVRWMREG